MKRTIRKLTLILLILMICIMMCSCGTDKPESGTPDNETVEKNGSVAILFTSDVHCGVDQGFGYAGLWQIRQNLEAQGYTTILVDNGDSIQGEPIGMMTKGEAVIELMNEVGYDVAVPGNHEFDYTAPAFVELTKKADFPYISCNFTYKDSPVLDAYTIIEAAGIKIAFVGVTTPETIITSTPAYFQDESGNYVYGFMQEPTGEKLYSAVQNAVDSARAEGADYVYVLGHLGMEAEAEPWTYADVIEHTDGFDVFLDGHSHDTEQVVMKNKSGGDVVRSACGTKLNCIGYSIITPEGISETNIWSWPNKASAPQVLGIQNEIGDKVSAKLVEINKLLEDVVAHTSFDLTIYDPEAKDSSGNPVRMVRRAETNLGNLCADALLKQSGADIALVNGGGIRTNLKAGDITYADIYKVFPFGNKLCIVQATGQQILDALEWGAKAVPSESGGFIQPAGLSYEIDIRISSSCTSDENGMMTGVAGDRRVKNVMIAGEPIDPSKTYTVAGFDYILLSDGDGNTAFRGSTLIAKDIKLDNQLLADYLSEVLGGIVPQDYADPYGSGRITIIE